MNGDGVLIVLAMDAVVCAILGAIIGAQKNAGVFGATLGAFFGPLGVIAAFAIDQRPQCPKCAVRLNGEAETCPACHQELAWMANDDGGRAVVRAEEASKYDQTTGKLPRANRAAANWAARAAAAEAEKEEAFKLAKEKGIAKQLGLAPKRRLWIRFVVWTAKTFDRSIYRLVGGRNNPIIYRFAQALAYGIVPLGIVWLVATIYLRN